ncbi:MAG: anti-sigma factor family protein [Acidobacteriota bacterium]
MNRECKRISARLSDYLDGELAPQDEREAEVHLEHCANCRQELARLRDVSQVLQSTAAAPEAPEQWPEIHRKLRERVAPVFFQAPQDQDQDTGQKRSWKRWLPLAAAVLVVLSFSLFWPFGPNPSTDVESYLGLYLLAGTADGVLSSKLTAEEIAGIGLDFPTYLPPAVNGWKREGVYLHRLHGQPVLQTFYSDSDEGGRHYCIFQQSSRHSLDFGNRQIQKEFVRNQVCTKFADQHFNLISWGSGKTLFTVVSTADSLDLNQIASQWIKQIE